jgi:hypothetical protein
MAKVAAHEAVGKFLTRLIRQVGIAENAESIRIDRAAIALQDFGLGRPGGIPGPPTRLENHTPSRRKLAESRFVHVHHAGASGPRRAALIILGRVVAAFNHSTSARRIAKFQVIFLSHRQIAI